MFKLVSNLDVIAWNNKGVFFFKSNHQLEGDNCSKSWVKRVVPGNGNHGGRLILNLYSKYWPN
jgi:hypothetical protein